MKGHAGRILRLNLTDRVFSLLDTAKYEQWIGGHGIATAVFFDLVNDKTVDCFHPGNTLVLMTGLFAGTLVPGSSRMELVGIQAQSWRTKVIRKYYCRISKIGKKSHIRLIDDERQ